MDSYPTLRKRVSAPKTRQSYFCCRHIGHNLTITGEAKSKAYSCCKGFLIQFFVQKIIQTHDLAQTIRYSCNATVSA